ADDKTASARGHDSWLTLAEIAAELRVNPSTVRVWVSRGQLRAVRAGQRKWLVRRSELDRMLRAGEGGRHGRKPPGPEGEAHGQPIRSEQSLLGEEPSMAGMKPEVREALERVQLADRWWSAALQASQS